METHLSKLSKEDRDLLLKAPAVVSFLAANSDGEITSREKADAIELSHLKTFTSPPLLHNFYKEAKSVFKPNLEQMITEGEEKGEAYDEELRETLKEIYKVTKKMDKNFSEKLKVSLNSYAHHVGSVHKNFLFFNVLLPVEIPGLTD